MEEIPKSIAIDKKVKTAPKQKLQRCMEWLQQQNDPKNKKNTQFINETNALRKKFLESNDTEDLTVPSGVAETTIEPIAVPIQQLRVKDLQMECEWKSCKIYFSEYELFQKHVTNHTSELEVIDVDGCVVYVCLWDVCGHKTSDYQEMLRHINYHAYHARLLAIGFNGRATLKLQKCNKDSSKRNQLPPLKHKHCCMWVGCSESYNSIQMLFDHVKSHIHCSKDLCSWAGCGATFPRRPLLTMHARTHTRERVIACYHCGQHFSCNRKLSDHLLRQNVDPKTGIPCSMCGTPCATEYLKREHERQHVSAYACTMCDMSAPSRAALAYHVRYRHLPPADTKAHACPHCPHRTVTKSDLLKHMPIHTRKRKRKSAPDEETAEDASSSDEKKKKPVKRYACHMCPEKEVKVFRRGTRLTSHLVKVHGARWPFGHSRFRYQISEDGMYRLTTTRFEYEDISKKIVDGYSSPKELTNNTFEFNVSETADATETTPKRFEISLKNNVNDDEFNIDNVRTEKEMKCKNNANDDEFNIDNVRTKKEMKCKYNVNVAEFKMDTAKSDREMKCNENSVHQETKAVEIMMCDVDEEGNITNTETIQSYQLLV